MSDTSWGSTVERGVTLTRSNCDRPRVHQVGEAVLNCLEVDSCRCGDFLGGYRPVALIDPLEDQSVASGRGSLSLVALFDESVVGYSSRGKEEGSIGKVASASAPEGDLAARFRRRSGVRVFRC
jgi:hypothetical protein